LVQKRTEATVSLLKLALRPENSIKGAKKETRLKSSVFGIPLHQSRM